jgi:hypothetical protein
MSEDRKREDEIRANIIQNGATWRGDVDCLLRIIDATRGTLSDFIALVAEGDARSAGLREALEEADTYFHTISRNIVDDVDSGQWTPFFDEISSAAILGRAKIKSALSVAKSEAEWWAHQEILALRARNAALTSAPPQLRELREVAHAAWHALDEGEDCGDGRHIIDDVSDLNAALKALCGDEDDIHYALEPIDAMIAALASSGSPASGMEEAVLEVVAERRRQVEAEGWALEHDDKHTDGALAKAATCYASVYPLGACYWPWDLKWWKPKDRRRNLVKAGALILAEIERIDRAASRSNTPPAPSDAQETI